MEEKIFTDRPLDVNAESENEKIKYTEENTDAAPESDSGLIGRADDNRLTANNLSGKTCVSAANEIATTINNPETTANTANTSAEETAAASANETKAGANRRKFRPGYGDLRLAFPSVSDDEYYVLPDNYSNRYNLTRGDFPPLSLTDALTASLQKRGKVDIEYISSLSLLSLKDVIIGLGNKIFRDPALANGAFYQGYVTADEYLSGNLMKKYHEAVEANKEAATSGRYYANIRALCAVMPYKPAFEEIFVTLGSPWLPPAYVADFVQYLYRLSVMRNKRICDVYYQREMNDWSVILNFDAKSTVLASKTFGTERMDMFKIIEKTLNHEQIRITDPEEGEKKGRRFNKEQTMLAEEKRARVIEAFNRWIRDLPAEKKDELVDVFYERFGCFRMREYDGGTLELKDIANGVKLYDYQCSAVARILQSKSTLLAHDVGAGKTYAMVVAAHELYKNGITRKNMIVVPNSIVEQWREDYMLLYPEAKVLTLQPLDFAPARRESTLIDIRDGDYESVILPYSSFELIPASYKFEAEELKERADRLEHATFENARKRNKIKNRLNTLLTKEREKVLARYAEADKKVFESEGTLTFDDLGITSLFIDEAHNYKNLPLDSSLGSVKGLNLDGSEKCLDVYRKAHSVYRRGGKIIFATGTPVTNSVADVYVMQKFLTLDQLEYCDLEYFDNWAGMFGEITRTYEIDVDTDNYRLTTRFNRFNNLTELSHMINGFTDFHVAGKDGLPEVGSIQTIVVKKTALQKALLKDMSSRVEKIRAGQVDRKTDNLLKVTTDGRKLALDARLIDENCEGDPGNKIAACADKVFEIYKKHDGKSQLVFCDIGTPKSEFNVYDCLKSMLVERGVPAEQIGFVHDATSDGKRAKLFDAVNKGVVRILIGSTFKLGTGVNVQEKLVAIHHLDVPWRPSDMVQRDGRLVRRGNTNERVYIYRYVTDGSFDAYSWQLLENKQRFITELLTGTANGADERQLDDAVLGYAEVKALAIGNPLIKNRVEVCNEIARLKTLEREERLKRDSLEKMSLMLPSQINDEKEHLSNVKSDSAKFESNSEIADKQLIAQLISKTIAENALNSQEIYIADVNGFKLYLPANFNKVRPYLVLEGTIRYTVDIVTFASGAVTKIENYLHGLKNTAGSISDRIDELEMQLKQAKAELERKDDYIGQIAELEAKLAEIDKELGLNEK